MGYGQGFITQAALLLDDMAGAGQALDYLAGFIYDADAAPYLVPEGVALHPQRQAWYRSGDLGNAVHEAEVIKTLALVAGVDNLDGRRLQIAPRLPPGWTAIAVEQYPVLVGGQRYLTGYRLQRQAQGLSMTIDAGAAVPGMDVRLGPLPAGASLQTTINGVAYAAEVEDSGDSRWMWLRGLPGGQAAQIDVQW